MVERPEFRPKTLDSIHLVHASLRGNLETLLTGDLETARRAGENLHQRIREENPLYRISEKDLKEIIPHLADVLENHHERDVRDVSAELLGAAARWASAREALLDAVEHDEETDVRVRAVKSLADAEYIPEKKDLQAAERYDKESASISKILMQEIKRRQSSNNSFKDALAYAIGRIASYRQRLG